MVLLLEFLLPFILRQLSNFGSKFESAQIEIRARWILVFDAKKLVRAEKSYASKVFISRKKDGMYRC